MATEADPLRLIGTVGGVVTLAGLIGGAAAWIVKTRREARTLTMTTDKEARKDALDEYREIVADQRSQLAQRDARIASLERRGDSLKQITEEALATVEEMAKQKAAAEGKVIATPLVPVIPERNSPVTKEEIEAAELATVRGRMVAASVALGLPAREPGVPETDDERKLRLLAERQKNAQAVEPDGGTLREAIAEVPAKVVEELDKRDEKGGT